MKKRFLPESWLDKPYLKYEGEYKGVPVYSAKKDDLSDEEYAEYLSALDGSIWFIDENKMSSKPEKESRKESDIIQSTEI